MAKPPYSKVLVVQKRSKYELDLEVYGSEANYRSISQGKEDVFFRTLESHERQVASRTFLREKVFPGATFVFREELEKSQNLQQFDLVVSHGGDNHFTYVAHKVASIPILGCNSDPKSSVGALLPFSEMELYEAVSTNFSNTIQEKWTQIATEIHYPDGRIVQTVPAICEVSVRNNSPDLTSRYWIRYKSDSEEQKCSGLLLYTGAGSTGWIASCFPKRYPPFSKDKPYFHVYSREIRAKSDHRDFALSDFRSDDVVEVISEMNGGIAIDSLTERHYPFPPFSKAYFRVAHSSLIVIVPKKAGELMNESSFEIKRTQEPDCIFIKIKGRMESGPLDQLSREITQIAATNDMRPFLIDLTELRYISSVGIRILLDFRINLLKTKRNFAMLGVQPAIAQVFQLLGLLQAFPHFETKEEAMESFLDTK